MNFYAIATFDNNGKCLTVFDGKNYSTDLTRVKLFSEFAIGDARTEAGGYQSLNCIDEVRILKILVSLPKELNFNGTI